MDLQHERGVGLEGALVVGEAGSIRGADLDQPAARLAHDLGHAEPAADLDQLAARHEHRATSGERGERHEYRRRVVVHDDARRRPARFREERGGVLVA